MAGLTKDTPIPTEIKAHQKSRQLEIHFDNGNQFLLPYEFLRVFSPSAEVRGHAPGQEKIQAGKREVTVERVEGVGNYAIKLVFSDGHDSGIYSWDCLYDLGQRQEALWQQYLDKLAAAGRSRDADAALPDASAGGCGSAGCSSAGCH